MVISILNGSSELTPMFRIRSTLTNRLRRLSLTSEPNGAHCFGCGYSYQLYRGAVETLHNTICKIGFECDPKEMTLLIWWRPTQFSIRWDAKKFAQSTHHLYIWPLIPFIAALLCERISIHLHFFCYQLCWKKYHSQKSTLSSHPYSSNFQIHISP